MVPPSIAAIALVARLVLAAATSASGAREHVLRAQMEQGAEDGGQERFEAALALLRQGRERDAARALLDLSRELPDDDIAPEALFEAAQIYDEQLADPEAARNLYGELLRRYPNSRLTRRAQSREAELHSGLRTGVLPYNELQDILRHFRNKDTVARLARLLREHPDFALSDRVRYLLGSALGEAGRHREAEQALKGLIAAQPSGEWAPRAQHLLGQMALQRGDLAEARTHFQALGRYGGALWDSAAAQGLAQTNQAQRNARYALGAAIFLVLLAAYLAYSGRRRLLAPPLELCYYLPVAVFLILVAILSGGGPISQAVFALCAGGAALVWLSGASARSGTDDDEAGRRPRGLRRGLAVLGGALLRLLAALSLGYLVVHHGGLMEVMIETLRHGPERH